MINTIPKEHNKDFGDRLRYLLWANKLTQRQLMDKAGTHSASTIKSWIDCRSHPNWHQLQRIAYFFDLTVHYIMYGTEQPPRGQSNDLRS